jgi:hypothetical protein
MVAGGWVECGKARPSADFPNRALIGMVVCAGSMPALLRVYESYFLHLHDVIFFEHGSLSTSTSAGLRFERSWQAPPHVRLTLF